MTTKPDPVQQVAEMPCPGLDCERGVILGYRPRIPRPLLDQDCASCHGTRLRWPTLSRECEGPVTGRWNDDCIYTMGTHSFGEDELEGLPCPCNGSGRVPDVTLEKVLDIHIAEGRTQPQDWFLFDRLRLRTPTEAACAALLAPVKA